MKFSKTSGHYVTACSINKSIMKSTYSFILLSLFRLPLMAQWEIVDYNSDMTYFSVFFINDSTGFVTGYSEPVNVIRKTTDYGNSWTTVYAEEVNHFYDVYFPSDSIGYTSAYENVLKTIDGGETWFYPTPEFAGYPYRSIVFQDNEIGFGCFTDNGAAFARTVDGGYTWLEEYEYGGREIIKVADCQFRMVDGYFHKSDDCWSEHESIPLPIDDRSDENIAYSTNDIVLSCGLGFNEQTWENFGFIGRSIDDGQNWMTLDFESIHALRSIVFTNTQTAYCVGQAYNPNPFSFLKSIDGGITWGYQEYELPCDNCFSPNVRDVYCTSENVCYAISSGGAIWRTLNGGGELFPLPVSVAENKQDEELLLYPVPTDGLLRLNLPALFGIISKTQVFDSMGQLVFTTNLNGSNAEIDVSHLAAGCYTLRANFESTVLTRSFMKN
jgi:photosystem II stability/assembly factor-like uncharacterized protein